MHVTTTTTRITTFIIYCSLAFLFIVHNNIVLSIKTNSYDTFHEVKIHNVKYDKEHKYLKGPISILDEKDSNVGKRRFLGTNEEEETPPSGASGGGTGETTGEQTCRSVQNTTSITSDIGKVDVQIYMMSTCKYGQAALNNMLPSVVNCKEASVKADFIGHGTAQRGFSSTLGRNDVIGDVYMLCAQQVFASKDITVMAVPYFQCLIKDTNEEMSVLGEACKEKVDNKDFQEAVYRCVRSRQVSYALEDSFKKSKDAGAVISPTIVINGEHYCGPKTPTGLEDAIAKAMQGISMTTLGECNENGVSNDSKGCKDNGSHYTYSILLFMILFSSTATLLLIACFAAFRRSPAGMVHNQRFNRGARMPWLQGGQGGVAMQQRTRGTPAEVFSQFDKVIFKKLDTEEQEEDQCSICICEYESGEEVLTLPCKHKFHAGCIRQWLQQSVRCPLCNQEVTSDFSNQTSSNTDTTSNDNTTGDTSTNSDDQ